MKRASVMFALALFVAGLAVAGGQKENASDSMSGSSGSMSSGTMVGSGGSMSDGSSSSSNDMKSDNSMSGSSEMTADPAVGHQLRLAPSSGHKVIFSTLAAAEAFARNGISVLFFAADWCPYCQADLRDINAHGDMLKKGITIVVVDYDKAADLKTRYGVTVQDTFVQIDATGQKLAVWNSGGVNGINQKVVQMM